MNIPADHISFTTIPEIQNIVQELFCATPVVYMHYARIYHDSKATILVSDAKWHDYYMSHKFYLSADNVTKENTCLVKALPGHQQEAQDIIQFGLDNKFEITMEYKDYYETIGLAGKAGDESIINFYFNQLGIIKENILLFKEKATPLICEADKSENILQLALNQPEVNTPKINLFKKNSFKLSKQEINCIRLLAYGRTAKQIAKQLRISHRTVEAYLENARNKSMSKNSIELVAKAIQLKLIS